jgi:hypothetical protein
MSGQRCSHSMLGAFTVLASPKQYATLSQVGMGDLQCPRLGLLMAPGVTARSRPVFGQIRLRVTLLDE